MKEDKVYTIVLKRETAEAFDAILNDEQMTPSEWLENMVNDYDS